MEEKKATVSWEEFEALKKENERLKLENELNKKQGGGKHHHSGEFWTKVHRTMVKDPEYVKQLVRNKILTMDDRRPRSGMTLLMLASGLGSQEIVQFCLNQGADITATDDNGNTALEIAGMYGYYHCEQLLLFATMNLGIGNEIKNISATIYQQNGINGNVLRVLQSIGEQSKNLFEGILMELMINLINNKLSFDDTMLSLCWSIAGRKGDPCDSELYAAIATTCSKVIGSDSKRDWHWLKRYIVPSMIWYQTDLKSKKFLYFKLLNLVDNEAMKQLNELEQDLGTAAKEDEKEWKQLTTYALPDQYERVRQDLVPNGIVSAYSHTQLLQSSGSTFNSPRFYDHNQYLSQLNLLAQIVDDEFQVSIQEMFDIDKVRGTGNLYDNIVNENVDIKKKGDGYILYQRGPLKRIERARNKTQNDYPDEAYPTSACVVDFNRCALIFNDIPTLLGTLQLFVNKVKYYQSGNIIGIARCKNGFVEYVEQIGYADVKLNVIIKGTHNNIIGEVQFLLARMKAFKNIAHRLYAIQRQKENIEAYVQKTLPILLDEDKHLYIAGNRGSVNELCEIMVTLNYSVYDLMKQDEASGRTIIHAVCILGHIRAFHFFKNILPIKDFVKYTCLSENIQGISPASYAIWKSHIPIIKVLFAIDEVKATFFNDNDCKYRLMQDIFCFNTNDDLMNYMLKAWNIQNKDVQEMIYYPYKSRFTSTEHVTKNDVYGLAPILNRLVRQSTIKELGNLFDIIGEKVFLDGCLMKDTEGNNALDKAIDVDKMDVMKYMLDTDSIRNKYMNDMELLSKLCKKMDEKFQETMVTYVVQKLNLSPQILERVAKYDVDVTKILEIVNKK